MADFAPLMSPDGDTNPAGLVDVLLTLSPAATMLLRPVYDASGEVVIDFDWVRLNPAAQRVLHLSAQPAASLLALFPEAQQAGGVFAFYREAFLAGHAAHCSHQYQHDGLASYHIVAAQRHEQLLVVSLSAASDPVAPFVESAPLTHQSFKQVLPHEQPAAHRDAVRVAEQLPDLDEQQNLLEQILLQVPAAVATLIGPEHRYTFFNDHYQGLSAHRVEVGKRIAEALPELVGQGFVDLLDQVYATGQPFTGTDKPVQLFDHTTGRLVQRYLDFSYQPLTNAQKQPQGILAFIVDTTERVLARQQVETANRELATINARLTRTNADLDTFVYSASHDLRAPISNIEGLLLALRQELPVEALQAELVPRLLELMDGAVARFQQTLGYITDVTRLQSEAADHATELVELSALVEAVRLDILPELTASRATLTVDLSEYPLLWASPRLLRSIFYNFLSNAIKYRAPDRLPLIHLRCRRAEPGYLTLEVQDNGLGLTQQQQGSLFQLFNRLHTHVSGSGVGLYMVKKMVDNIGGMLTVQSQPGVGSTFIVRLPLSNRPLPQ
jgi:signal transduction histidine kinase